MYKLIKIGTYELRNPEGSFSLNLNDNVNEYEGENGHKTVEIIRQDQISADVSYKGLTVDEVAEIKSYLSTVTTLTLFDPLNNLTIEIIARISGIKVSKVYHKNDLSVWSLSFKIDEL